MGDQHCHSEWSVGKNAFDLEGGTAFFICAVPLISLAPRPRLLVDGCLMHGACKSVSDAALIPAPTVCYSPLQLLLDYVHQSGQDKRNRSRTRGAKHPAFALFVNEQDHHIVLAVRGTQDKNDHLTDLDLADCQLSEKDPSGVHRGMLNGARYILDEWGLLPFLKTAPSNYSIRLVGHSLGAGNLFALDLLIPLILGTGTPSQRSNHP